MNANPMEEQVGRLVGNLLARGGEVFLPGVGSLYVERQGARRIDRRRVQPPCRTVLFTSQQRGVSLVDEIARVMRESGEYENPEADAQAVYERWIGRVHQVNLLTVEGVGELRFKTFTPDEAFDLRLNPQGHEPVRIPVKRRFDWPLWVGIAAILIALVYGGREFLMLYPEEPKGELLAGNTADSLAVSRPDALAEAPAAQLPEAAASPESPASGTDISSPAAASGSTAPSVASPAHAATASSAAVGSSSAAASSPSPVVETQPAGDQSTPMALLSGRHYVVLGVFSTEENARRAVRETAEKQPGFRCRIYRFGEKFMVSPFSSDDAAVCAQFIRAQSDGFPGMWTYTAR